MDCTKKPIRKRSRASKKSAATILTANPTNFRALVQQFTGFPSQTVSSGGQKGPINLNFRLGKVQDRLDSAIIAPSGHSYYQCHQPISQSQQPQQVQQYQQQLQREQQCQLVSVSQGSVVVASGGSDGYFPTFSNPAPRGLEMPVNNGFSMDDFSLHELNGESFAGAVVNAGYFQPEDHERVHGILQLDGQN